MADIKRIDFFISSPGNSLGSNISCAVDTGAVDLVFNQADITQLLDQEIRIMNSTQAGIHNGHEFAG